jgi:putative FmdB family regulatory protein
MPLYEYRCDACGQPFEVIQKFSEVSETCRLCGKGPVHRQVSAPGFQFKGTGWYITDYAQKGKAGGDTAGGKADADKGDSKKPEAASSDTPTKGGDSAPASPTVTAAKTSPS